MTAQPPPSTLAAQCPALRPDALLSGPLLSGPATVHLVKAGPGGRAFVMGEKEHFLMARLDGRRTLGELGEEYAQHFGRRLGDANWAQLLRLLWVKGLMKGAPDPAPSPEPARRTPLAGTFELVPDATTLTDRLLRAVGFALRPWILLPLLLLAAAMEAVLARHLDGYLHQSARLLHQPASLAAVGCALWISSALHELAHGLVARRFGARVGGMGLRWRMPVVIAYCTVDDLPFLRSRRQQIATAAAGTIANLFFLLPFWALAVALPPGSSARPAVAGLLLSGSALALVNLVPLPPFDGYKMVGQALRVHRLATESRRYLALRAARALGRDGDSRADRYPRRARAVYMAYGLGALLSLAGAATAWAVLWYHALAPRHGLWAGTLPGTALLVLILITTLSGRWSARRHRATTTSPGPATNKVEGT